MRSLWLFMGFLAACGSGESDRHPATPDAGGSTSTGGSRPHAGSPSKPDAGQAGAGAEPEAGAAGEGGTAGEPPIIYEMGGLPQNMPGLCDPTMKLGSAEAQELGVPGATLLAMSPDELSVVFTTGSDDTLALYVADRATTDDDFAALQVTIPAGYYAAKGASLSSGGKRLIFTRDDDSGFAEVVRDARGGAFGVEPGEERFAKINALKPMSGRSVGWPVLSSDGKALYFVSYFGQAVVVQSALGADDTFSIGTEIDQFTLGGKSGEYKLITGLAVDQRAIFFVDQATSHAMALFRSRPEAPFYEPLDLGERQGAAPNADCTRIYSTLNGGLVFQARE